MEPGLNDPLGDYPPIEMNRDFGDAYQDQVSSVYGFFAYRVANRGDAEDLTQQTFERALRAWANFDPERAALGVWLMAIARNMLVDHYRGGANSEQGKSLDAVAEERLGSEIPQPDLGIDPALADALATLSPRDREILALRFGADMAGPQIASLTGLSLANVQQILSRSLRKLRSRLEQPASG